MSLKVIQSRASLLVFALGFPKKHFIKAAKEAAKIGRDGLHILAAPPTSKIHFFILM